ncbi:MAG: hypothetical protein JSV19_05530 [Phycisphaerales bacterium]|nr:MAG: hypothetical protein JSV19_05530 [Phycisphaerales bacterium]
MSTKRTSSSASLSDLPRDQLIEYGRELGLLLTEDTPQGEALRLVRQRQDLLVDLDRQAMLDVVVWMRRPVRESAGKETLAKEIARCDRVDFTGLSRRGLEALARLRDLELREGEPRERLESRLRGRQGLWGRVRRRRRRIMGRLVSRLVEGKGRSEPPEYRFLPEDDPPSLQHEIENQGVVGGIARKLRGVADDYVREKLDEIEVRIDRKLDEIDERLAEWRDREVANRLRILRITLVFSILVALLCLVYDYARSH